MEIFEPKRQVSSSRFDMTCTLLDSGLVYPLGYCAGWRELPTETPYLDADLRKMAAEDVEKRRPHREKYHTDSHETSGEALACWRRYLLENRLEFFSDPSYLRRCTLCRRWVTSRARLRGEVLEAVVCAAHDDLQSLLAAFWPGG